MQTPHVVTTVTQGSGGQAVRTTARAICWRLRAFSGEQATCTLQASADGWLLRIDVNGNLQRAQEFATQDQWIGAAVRWKTVLLEGGWREASNSTPPRPVLSVRRQTP